MLEFFLLRTHKTIFRMENLTQWWTQSGPFFPKSGLYFQKGQGKHPFSSLVVGHEYASVSLNMPKYIWKCSNKLFWPCQMIILHVRQAFEDACGSKKARVLNMARLCMQGLRRVLNMSDYGSICFKNAWYASVNLNVLQYAWTWLSIAECPPWICPKMPE